MSNNPPATPNWIDTPATFAAMLVELRDSPILAVDTESNSLFVYHERVCLVQISTGQADYLIDPLVIDIRPLGDLFSSPGIEKVFHAAEYDIICLRRDYQFSFSNIFDTMVAARLLKKTALGLASILKTEFNVVVDKRHQRANWGERPVKPAMLEYARQDTHYLIPLREQSALELHKAGMWELAQEDFRRLELTDGRPPVKPDCWSVAGRENLAPLQMATLQGLVEYRDRYARRIDQPLFKVMSDQSLVALARVMPKNRREMQQTMALSEKQMHRHADELLAVIRKGVEGPLPKRKINRRPPEIYLTRYEKLKRWRSTTASEMGLESDVILPKDIIRAIAELREITRENLKEAMCSTPWRFQRFGERILAILAEPISTERL
ncbi:MAG: HRDC domain-containing protein [Anaerolineaceae bacterium]|nr:HRDC domain-containing protein [Anaerolineaceae bacterium]